MYEGNPGEIDFGSSSHEVRVIGSRLYWECESGKGKWTRLFVTLICTLLVIRFTNNIRQKAEIFFFTTMTE